MRGYGWWHDSVRWDSKVWSVYAKSNVWCGLVRGISHLQLYADARYGWWDCQWCGIGMVWYDMMSKSKAWWHGWCWLTLTPTWPPIIWCGMIWYGMLCKKQSMVWLVTLLIVWYDMAWWAKTGHGMVGGMAGAGWHWQVTLSMMIVCGIGYGMVDGTVNGISIGKVWCAKAKHGMVGGTAGAGWHWQVALPPIIWCGMIWYAKSKAWYGWWQCR